MFPPSLFIHCGAATAWCRESGASVSVNTSSASPTTIHFHFEGHYCLVLAAATGENLFLTCVGGIEAIAEGRHRHRLSSPLRAAVVGVRGGGLPGPSGHQCVVVGGCERRGDNRWARIKTGKLGSEVISAGGGGGDGRRRSRSWRGSNIEGVEISMRCIWRKLQRGMNRRIEAPATTVRSILPYDWQNPDVL